MKKPWYQDVILYYVAWIVAGIFFVGSILDTVINSVDVITPQITYYGTGLILLGLFVANFLLKRSPALWISRDGQNVRIKSLGKKAIFLFSGVIVGLWAPRFLGDFFPSVSKQLVIESIALSTRGAEWDNDFLSSDEIIVTVMGSGNFDKTRYVDTEIIAFWRLANKPYWHVGKRQSYGSYVLATFPTKSTLVDNWEFLVGGIECDKDFLGHIEIVLYLMEKNAIEDNLTKKFWLDYPYIGMADLPTDGVIAVSQISTFYSGKVR